MLSCSQGFCGGLGAAAGASRWTVSWAVVSVFRSAHPSTDCHDGARSAILQSAPTPRPSAPTVRLYFKCSPCQWRRRGGAHCGKNPSEKLRALGPAVLGVNGRYQQLHVPVQGRHPVPHGPPQARGHHPPLHRPEPRARWRGRVAASGTAGNCRAGCARAARCGRRRWQRQRGRRRRGSRRTAGRRGRPRRRGPGGCRTRRSLRCRARVQCTRREPAPDIVGCCRAQKTARGHLKACFTDIPLAHGRRTGVRGDTAPYHAPTSNIRCCRTGKSLGTSCVQCLTQ